MKVLVDTHVVLDVLLNRTPFVASSAKIFSLTETSEITSYLCATTLTTVDYLLLQSLEKRQSRKALSHLMGMFEVAPVNRTVLESALSSKIKDFEDAVIEQSAVLVGAQIIITRNTKDYKNSVVRALDPIEFLASCQRVE